MSTPKQLSPEYLAQDRGYILVDISILFIVLGSLFFALFVVSKIANHNQKGLEFYCYMPLGYFFNMMNCLCGILMVVYGGAGRHVEFLALNDPEKIINFLKIRKVTEFTYAMSITCPKLAILYLYLQIFSTPRSRIILKVVSALVIATGVACILTSFLDCRPFAYSWDLTIPGGHCTNVMASYQYISIPNILFDLFLLIFPMPAIYKLHVKRPVKIGLIITFCTGSIGMITAIIRMEEFFTINLISDPTYLSTRAMLWSIIEGGMYLIAACMPSLRPLKKKILKDTSWSYAFSSVLSKVTSQPSAVESRSWKSKGVTITTEITQGSGMSNLDSQSTTSTCPIIPHGDGFVELNDIHATACTKSGAIENVHR